MYIFLYFTMKLTTVSFYCTLSRPPNQNPENHLCFRKEVLQGFWNKKIILVYNMLFMWLNENDVLLVM